MTHLLLGKSEVPSDLVASAMTYLRSEAQEINNKGSCEIQIIVVFPKLYHPENGF